MRRGCLKRPELSRLNYECPLPIWTPLERRKRLIYGFDRVAQVMLEQLQDLVSLALPQHTDRSGHVRQSRSIRVVVVYRAGTKVAQGG
jgi:hypothetical protein